ncbi:uncharacterized protein STEHIDRAFT_117150 [Stereum hirsutum FP-91666 SS1]|uniref:uncharacterized protein n=1 Tax=Stereum hirsutum (strain FP-91666) TaxID=721885 RepID=UPI000440DAFC|nr:uncharacterized protein STEHIDRAFT_117150 [Stereum hirsutum FP-91666 SS1]EIM92060.1 hypothetical protein STEHIDRAFT_117150 [Stereum hirsutum FP-91666 SS1]
MSSIGPSLLPHLVAGSSKTSSPPPGPTPSTGPTILTSAGPQISNGSSPAPAHEPQSYPTGPQLPPSSNPGPPRYEEEEEEEEDDYAPALPPDLAASRSGTNSSAGPPKRVLGPSMGPARREEEEESEDEVGPVPLPQGVVLEEEDGVREFLEKEEQRRKAIEEAAKPKALKREEWMLVPPSASDLLSNIDPTKLTKSRQFSRSTAPSRGQTDNSLWTETPAERQQRLADEVSGKKRRAENGPSREELEAEEEARKRRKKDMELKRDVEEHTRKTRGPSLIDAHDSGSKSTQPAEKDEVPGVWDHSRDMGLGGRLMDEKDRRKMINDAKGLSERFGSGSRGGFL